MNIKLINQRKIKKYEVLGYGDNKLATNRMWVLTHKKCGFIRSLPPMDNQIICHYCKKYFPSDSFIKLRLRVES